MKQRMNFLKAVVCTAVGTLGVGLTSCDNSREMPEPMSKEMHTVTTECMLLQEDGTLISFDSESLKAAENEKGKITGAGTYYHNQEATITATAKGSYKLLTLYEKASKKGFSFDAGKSGISNGTSKSITTQVDQDLHFIAVFMGVEGSERGYKDLKLNGQNQDLRLAGLAGKDTQSGNITTIGSELSPVKTYNGSIIDWAVTNASYGNWLVKNVSQTWLTVNAGTGKVTYSMPAYKNKTAGARTATFLVGKDGTIPTAPKVWRTVTVVQNSYWDSREETPTNPDKIVDGSGAVVTLPVNKSHAFPATGGKVDIVTLLGYKAPIYALYKTYVNGTLQPESQWVKLEIKPSYSAKPTWTNLSGTQYSAGANLTSATRTGTVTVTWKAGSYKVGTSVVTFSQVRKEYIVDAEVL